LREHFSFIGPERGAYKVWTTGQWKPLCVRCKKNHWIFAAISHDANGGFCRRLTADRPGRSSRSA